MYSNSYFQTGLITGTQWDTIMKWLQVCGYDVTNDSRGFGNFYQTTKTLRGGRYAYYSSDGGVSWIRSLTKPNEARLIKTGASKETRSNNIYDLAGNLVEWSCEKQLINTFIPCYRGSNFHAFGLSPDSASFRNGSVPSYTTPSLGFRVVLYLQ